MKVRDRINIERLVKAALHRAHDAPYATIRQYRKWLPKLPDAQTMLPKEWLLCHPVPMSEMVGVGGSVRSRPRKHSKAQSRLRAALLATAYRQERPVRPYFSDGDVCTVCGGVAAEGSQWAGWCACREHGHG